MLDGPRGTWPDSEQKAKGLLLKTVLQSLRRELMGLKISHVLTTQAEGSETATTTTHDEPTTAYTMWTHLQTKFGKKAGLMPLLDYKALVWFNFVDDGTLEAQFNKPLDAYSVCSLNDFILKDWQFTSLTLLTLPETYSNITDSLLSSADVKELSFNVIKAKVIDQEACCCNNQREQ